MKLYVDDIRNAPDDKWSVARTVDTAIRFIERFSDEITHISLDHDISHQVQVGTTSRPYPCDETFQSVARFIYAHYNQYTKTESARPKITIHTANPSGADALEKILIGFEIEVKMLGAANRLETEIQ